MSPEQPAADNVRRFNASVTAGDLSPLVDSLSDDATIEVIEVRQTAPASALVAYPRGARVRLP